MGVLEDMDEIGKKRANVKSGNFRDGKGVVMIRKIVYGNMNDGPTYVVETEIIESHKTEPDVEPNTPGSTVAWVQKVRKHHQTAPGNIKAHILALEGVDEDTMDASGKFGQVVAAYCDKTQPAAGVLMRYETYRQGTKANPNDKRTYVRWANIPENEGNTKAEIEARRKERGL